MNGLFAAAQEMGEFCRQQGWKFCFIGGLAVLRWGEHRTTQDWVDIQGVILRQEYSLDEQYVFEQLTPLCEVKGAPEVLGRLREMFTTSPA